MATPAWAPSAGEGVAADAPTWAPHATAAATPRARTVARNGASAGHIAAVDGECQGRWMLLGPAWADRPLLLSHTCTFSPHCFPALECCAATRAMTILAAPASAGTGERGGRGLCSPLPACPSLLSASHFGGCTISFFLPVILGAAQCRGASEVACTHASAALPSLPGGMPRIATAGARGSTRLPRISSSSSPTSPFSECHPARPSAAPPHPPRPQAPTLPSAAPRTASTTWAASPTWPEAWLRCRR